MAKRRRIDSQALQLESLLFSLKQIREGRRDPPMIFSFSFSDVIKNQVYLNFYGIATRSTRDTTQINYETGEDGDVTSSSSNTHICQTITPSEDIYIDEVELFGSSVSDGGYPNHQLTIQTTSGGEPTGLIISTATTNVDFDSASDVWVTCTFPRTRLKSGVVYAIVMDVTMGGGSINYRADTSSPTYAGGSVGTSADAGSTWSMDTAKDLYFRINGTTENPYKLFPASGIVSDPVTTAINTTAIAKDDVLSDYDFDFEIQHTIAVKGLALLEIDTTGGYDTITLNKWDGTTETQLATASTDSSKLVSLNIANQTVIQRGDILRLTIQMKALAAGAVSYTLKHSGADLKLSVPVKLIGDI